MVRARGDRETLDLLGWEPERAGGLPPELRGPDEVVIPRLISSALEQWDRHEAARRLSLQLDRRVSKATIDTWASPARTANRIPLDAAKALAVMTGDLSLVRWLAAALGQVVVKAELEQVVRDVALIRDIEDAERRLAAAKAAANSRLTGGGGDHEGVDDRLRDRGARIAGTTRH